MSIICLNPDDLLPNLPAPVPVKEPLGAPIAETRSQSFPGASTTRAGAWECSPGDWRRQILQAEFCTILAGRATFEPDVGQAISLSAGQSFYFPANSTGVWRIEETLKKVFVLFDETAAG